MTADASPPRDRERLKALVEEALALDPEDTLVAVHLATALAILERDDAAGDQSTAR